MPYTESITDWIVHAVQKFLLYLTYDWYSSEKVVSPLCGGLKLLSIQCVHVSVIDRLEMRVLVTLLRWCIMVLSMVTCS